MRHVLPTRVASRRACVVARLAVPAALALALAAPTAFGAPATPPGGDDAVPPAGAPSSQATASASAGGTRTPTLKEARDRAIELEDLAEGIRADRVALETRIQVTNERIFRQQELLLEAARRLAEARTTLSTRLVTMYKSTALEPVSLLLTSDSFGDFLGRLALLARVTEIDNLTLRDAIVAAGHADYEAAALDDLKAQDVALRALLEQREGSLVVAIAEQKALVAKLTAEERRRLEAHRTRNAMSRKAWRDSSIPVGESVPMAEAVVEPYADRTYTVAAYQPRRYRSTGETYDAVCSWYGPGFNGNATASGQIFNQDDLTCASKTLPFGTRLALTRGERRIIVVVNDRGPFIAGRDLDLSREAARRLGFSGVETVHVEVVEALKAASSQP